MQIRSKVMTIFVVTMIMIIKVALFNAEVFEKLNSFNIIISLVILICIYMWIRKIIDKVEVKKY